MQEFTVFALCFCCLFLLCRLLLLLFVRFFIFLLLRALTDFLPGSHDKIRRRWGPGGCWRYAMESGDGISSFGGAWRLFFFFLAFGLFLFFFFVFCFWVACFASVRFLLLLPSDIPATFPVPAMSLLLPYCTPPSVLYLYFSEFFFSSFC